VAYLKQIKPITLFCLLVLHIALFRSVAVGQTLPSDPYRNFVGDWSGVIEKNSEDMPSTLTLHITEEVKKNRMRWDYVFGKPGEKGYTRDTKWIALKPGKEEMSTKWKGQDELEFKTINLHDFDARGFGVFVARERGALQRCTYELRPATLDYLWETADGQSYKIYSKFHFTRDGTDTAPTSAKEYEPNHK
jgi:hypothetical protein